MTRRSSNALRTTHAAQWAASAAALFLVPCIRLALRTRGFTWTKRHLATLVSQRTHAPARTSAGDLAIAVTRVTCCIPGTTCLPRSLTLWFILRRAGFQGDLAIGARRDQDSDESFAHAWVEVDGRPVGERFDVGDIFPRFRLETSSNDR